jgi:hypothetical protein
MRGHAPARLLGPLLCLLPVLGCGFRPALAAPATQAALTASGAATAPIRGRQPATVTIPVSAALREALGQAAASPAGAGPSVRLTVEGIEPPAAAVPLPPAPATPASPATSAAPATQTAPAAPAVGVRVFLDAPEATAATPRDDPHYVGSFAFYGGRGSPAAPARTSFLLDLGRTLRALGPPERWLHGDGLTVTLLAVPLRRGEPIDDVSLPFEKVSLSVRPHP